MVTGVIDATALELGAASAGVLAMSKVARIAMMVFIGQSLALWVLQPVLQGIAWRCITLAQMHLTMLNAQPYLQTG